MTRHPRPARPPVQAFLRRAADRQLSCPYCTDVLHAGVVDAERVQLRCPTCGFTETPDRVEPKGVR